MAIDDNVRARLNIIKLHTDPLVQAQMIMELKKTSDLPNVEIARFLEIKPAYLSHLIRIMKLPELIIDGYMSKQITFTHLILISRLKTGDDMVNLYEEILKNNLNVAQTEQRIRHRLYLIDTVGQYLSAARLETIKQKIKAALAPEAGVEIVQTRIKAKITIELPGDLQKTSEFVESFSSRFRKKRDAEVAQKIKNTSDLDQQDVLSKGQEEALSTEEVREEVEEQKEKFRFDPDF